MRNGGIGEYRHEFGSKYKPNSELIEAGWTKSAIECYAKNSCSNCYYLSICDKFRANNCEPPIKGVIRELINVYGDPKLNEPFLDLLTDSELLLCCSFTIINNNLNYHYCKKYFKFSTQFIQDLLKSIRQKITPRLLICQNNNSISLKCISDYLLANYYDELVLSWQRLCKELNISCEINYEKEKL